MQDSQAQGCGSESLGIMSWGNYMLKLSKGGLLVLLSLTVVLNVVFIVETNRRLDRNLQISNQVSQHENRNQKEDKRLVPHTIHIELVSSKEQVLVKVNAELVLLIEGGEENRGIHLLVLHQTTGRVMARRLFDTYQSGEDEAMLEFLNNVSTGRILIFAIKDEGSFQLKDVARQKLKALGSEAASELHWRDMWGFITITGRTYGAISEKVHKSPDLGSWGDKVSLSATIPFLPDTVSECKNWPNTDETRRRRTFCDQYEGYGAVCSCVSPLPLDFPVQEFESGGVLDIPVSVIASNRPQYLFRMLTKMLQVPGVPKDKVTIFIDGYFDEPLAVTQVLGLRGLQHSPLGKKNARISQHYKSSITATFNYFPNAEYIILIEEDLDLAPDFFSYFLQTKHLLDNDSSLYCVSAWNDQGYDHSCHDPALLYRVETMPGLGWMMKKSLFKTELEPEWPSADKLLDMVKFLFKTEKEPDWPSADKQWDWDMWMRHPKIRKGRECIIPDISRTYHFGSKGLNIFPQFQQMYFQKHTLQSLPRVKLKDVDKMVKEPYEDIIKDLIQHAHVLDHSKDPCAAGFIPKSETDGTYVMYIKMENAEDFVTWKELAKCYKLWDLDVRGFHKSMWRQFLDGQHLIIVGVPASPYAVYKPEKVTPIYLPEKKPAR